VHALWDLQSPCNNGVDAPPHQLPGRLLLTRGSLLYREIFHFPRTLSNGDSYLGNYEKKKNILTQPLRENPLGDRKSVIGVPKHWAGGPKSDLRPRVSSSAW
jgi:hypothetical protein